MANEIREQELRQELLELNRDNTEATALIVEVFQLSKPNMEE